MTLFFKHIQLKKQLSFAPEYQFDDKENCYNVKRGIQLTRSVIGYTEGYSINGKFKSLTKLREHMEEIPNENLPF
jgi:hypothetical protein